MTDQDIGIYKLKGVVKYYDWGGTEYLSGLFSVPNPEKNPMAEYWLGVHHSASSEIQNNRIKLSDLVESAKEKTLGSAVAQKFGNLPYLLKVLDVKDMLSIQVHPAKHAAELGFADENAKKIPLTDSHRNYKDDNHKPELMVALGDFWLLHGFKPAAKLSLTLREVPEFGSLLQIFESTGYDQLYKTVMEMPQKSVDEILDPLVRRITALYHADQLDKANEDYWAARAATTFGRQAVADSLGHDRGIFSIYFLNLLQLRKGEGIFQDAGILHAYLQGQNIEIMASSDNVLRGGLTNKHIDVRELMKHVRFEGTVPQVIHPKKINGEEVYLTAAPDFKLSRFGLTRDTEHFFDSVTGEIVLVIEGRVEMRSGKNVLTLSAGDAAFISSHHHISIKALANTEIYRASVPVHTGE
jgi:mannose-6-phosphate isomerase